MDGYKDERQVRSTHPSTNSKTVNEFVAGQLEYIYSLYTRRAGLAVSTNKKECWAN